MVQSFAMFTLQEALNALKGHDEFAVKQYDGLVTLDYIVCFPGSFDPTPDEIRTRAQELALEHGKSVEEVLDQATKEVEKNAWLRRNFRGVTFDSVTGEIVSLPLHKFFNVNQTQHTQFHLLKDCQATIYEKLDGSMIHFFVHPHRGELLAATCRSTQTPQAQEALQLAHKNDVVLERIFANIQEGWTPIFEFLAPHNQIVVEYPRRRLVYLISRNRKTGEYRFDETFPDKAQRYEFGFGDIFTQLDRTEFEGYVCHLDNGMLVKAKTPWYLERHRAVDVLMRPAYKVYELVFQGIMDDILPTAPERYQATLRTIYQEAQRDLLNEKLRLEGILSELIREVGEPKPQDREQRKTFVFKVQAKYPDDFSLLMQLYSGRDPKEGIQKRLMDIYRVKYPNRLFADLDDVG